MRSNSSVARLAIWKVATLLVTWLLLFGAGCGESPQGGKGGPGGPGVKTSQSDQTRTGAPESTPSKRGSGSAPISKAQAVESKSHVEESSKLGPGGTGAQPSESVVAQALTLARRVAPDVLVVIVVAGISVGICWLIWGRRRRPDNVGGIPSAATQRPATLEAIEELIRKIEPKLTYVEQQLGGLPTQVHDEMEKHRRTLENDFASTLKVVEGTVASERKLLGDSVQSWLNTLKEEILKELGSSELGPLRQRLSELSAQSATKTDLNSVAQDLRQLERSFASLEQRLGQVEKNVLDRLSPYIPGPNLQPHDRLRWVLEQFEGRCDQLSQSGRAYAEANITRKAKYLLELHDELVRPDASSGDLGRFLDKVDQCVFYPKPAPLSRVILDEREATELAWVEAEMEGFRRYLAKILADKHGIRPLSVVPGKDKFDSGKHNSPPEATITTTDESRHNLVVRVVENGYCRGSEILRKATVQRLVYGSRSADQLETSSLEVASVGDQATPASTEAPLGTELTPGTQLKQLAPSPRPDAEEPEAVHQERDSEKSTSPQDDEPSIYG
ncbi:MAG: hypothetical protein AMXMBFR61_25190 [Fimbriimonadales bacterium]